MGPKRVGPSGPRVGGTPPLVGRTHTSSLSSSWRAGVTVLAVIFLTTSIVAAAPEPPLSDAPIPPPPRGLPPPPPPDYHPPPPPPVVYPPPGPPPVIIQPAPPPLSPAMRIIYAPFYAAGLIVRYGFYYLIVAPFEVFGRALGYGVEGGVDKGDSDR